MESMNHKKGPLPVSEQLCFSIYSLNLAMNKLYRKVLKDIDLTYPQYLVMLVLWETDNLSVNEIGEKLDLDSATLTPLLKRMESSGLLTRARSAEDERVVIVSLMAAGKKLRAKAEQIQHTVGKATACTLPELQRINRQLRDLKNQILKTEEP